jgi:hypothetical protein
VVVVEARRWRQQEPSTFLFDVIYDVNIKVIFDMYYDVLCDLMDETKLYEELRRVWLAHGPRGCTRLARTAVGHDQGR